MLNKDYKKQAERDLNKANIEYAAVFKKTIFDMEKLQEIRKMAVRTIRYVEQYAVDLANKPRNIETKIGEIRIRCDKFEQTRRELASEAEQSKVEKTNGLGVAGVLGGVGLAALGPTAAMSVAMAFGTASTGTAIASLSGVAATNAALAWLGGGALTVGGAGMAAGQTVLALSGPVGWVIGGASLAASLLAANISNKEIAEKTEKSVVAIKKEMERIKEIDVQIQSWHEETKKNSGAVMRQLNKVKRNSKKDCSMFSDDAMDELISLFNSTEVLSKLIGKTIEGEK